MNWFKSGLVISYLNSQGSFFPGLVLSFPFILIRPSNSHPPSKELIVNLLCRPFPNISTSVNKTSNDSRKMLT